MCGVEFCSMRIDQDARSDGEMESIEAELTTGLPSKTRQRQR